MTLAIIIVVILVAVAFDYTNGFHDAANAIATSVSTRALTPRAALALAAVFNLAGSLVSVTQTHSSSKPSARAQAATASTRRRPTPARRTSGATHIAPRWGRPVSRSR